MRGGATESSDSPEGSRGVSPQVGFVLLVGIVFVGATIVGITGFALIDSLEGQAESEVTYSAIETTSHGIGSAASTGQQQSIADEGSYTDDGTVSLVWYGDGDPADTDSDKRIDDQPLGAIEYETDDGIVAYQGGGTWESQNGGYHAYSDPPIGYDSDGEDAVLEIQLVTLDESDLDGSEPTARPNPDSELPAEIEDVTDNATSAGYNNISLEIESSYHDGWEEYFDSEFGEDNVDSDQTEESVTLEIEDVTETYSAFWVAEDHGLESSDENVYIDDETDGPPELSATIENRGEETDTQDIELTLESEDGSTVMETESVKLEEDEDEDVSFELAEEDLTYGQEYEYDFETDDGNTLEDKGSFYYAKQNDPYLRISNETVDGMDASDSETPVEATEDNVTIEVDVQNIGATNMSSPSELEPALEAEESNENDPYELEDSVGDIVEYNASQSEVTTWELDRSKLLSGEHEFTITALDSGDDAVGYFDVEEGVDAEDTELYLDPNTEVNISVVGTEVSAEETNRYSNNRKDNAPISVDVKTQPVDEEGESTGEDEKYWDTGWSDRNLNTYQNRWKSWDYNFTTEDRVSLQLEATSYQIGSCSSWGYAGTQEYVGSDWNIYQCPENDLPDHESYNILETIEADTDTDTAGVRVLSQENNHLPELRGGHYTQLSADEVLERPDVGVTVEEGEDGEGYVQLDENEYIFVFEITDSPGQGVSADEYWEDAFDAEGSGDPNFNDAIAHVEITPGETDDFGAVGGFNAGDGEGKITSGLGDSSSDEGYGIHDPDVDVGSDEIIIG